MATSAGSIVAIDSSTSSPKTSLASPPSSLSSSLGHAGLKGKPFETRIFYEQDGHVVAAVGTGKKEPKTDAAKAEVTRKLAGKGALALKDQGVKTVKVDPVWSAHAAAEGATLATFNWSLKTKKDAIDKRQPLSFEALADVEAKAVLEAEKASGKRIGLDFGTGLVYGRAQNLARELMDEPANRMTPTIFCDRIQAEFKGLANVDIIVHDKAWAMEKKMNTFLSVAAGSDEPCKFLEIHYKGTGGKGAFKPSVAFVGKGITFDSGGISLKPGANMELMRADMGGAACVTAAAWAIAKLGIPIDLVVCVPLTENLPSGRATKPGDVIVSMQSKTVSIVNTDAEGRLVLADALWYASSTWKPKTIIDVATLTGAMVIALGEAFAGVFSTSDELWSELEAAGKAESDPFWRMPFDSQYMKQIDSTNADLCNTGGRMAGSCTAAIFLREFVSGLAINVPEKPGDESGQDEPEDTIRYAHVDIAGVMESTVRPEVYNPKGMSGRPVRSLIAWAREEAAKAD